VTAALVRAVFSCAATRIWRAALRCIAGCDALLVPRFRGALADARAPASLLLRPALPASFCLWHASLARFFCSSNARLPLIAVPSRCSPTADGPARAHPQPHPALPPLAGAPARHALLL
jgi:hypothetical protein